MTRAALLPLLLALSGCISYCKAGPILDRAARGDRAALSETGDLGRPRVPSTAEPLPTVLAAFEAIRPSLTAADAETRVVAIEAARHLAERCPDVWRNHFPGLFDRCLSDDSPEVRWRAAWALGRLGAATDALRAAAKDADDEVAAEVLLALGRAGDEQALPAFREALDRSPVVQRGAIAGLVRLAGKELPDSAAWKKWVEGREKIRASVAPVASADTATISS